jgi:hypothetical protein
MLPSLVVSRTDGGESTSRYIPWSDDCKMRSQTKTGSEQSSLELRQHRSAVKVGAPKERGTGVIKKTPYATILGTFVVH